MKNNEPFLKGNLMKNLIIFSIIIILSIYKLPFANTTIDTATLNEFHKAEKILWVSEITSISSIVALYLSGISLYETYSDYKSDIVFVSKDKYVAWSLFASGIISEGLSIAGIAFGIKKIKIIRENFEIKISTNTIGAKYSLLF